MYQVLYRKYRPRIFDDVVGQDDIVTTLKNEVQSGQLNHAYIFSGSRGTGKTTCAKIFAKAVNCLHPIDGNPCNECEICRGIDDGSILDVAEMDAASNNSVNNIRDIRDEANFAPAVCKYRVYILDEAHMLSNSASNALLKTLEEPPEHVKFILATTDIQKLPVTVLSRCQRFDFKRVSAKDMKKRVDYIAQQEGFSISDDAALLISKLSDGGMRDAISMLDRCAGLSDTIDAELVASVAGLAGKEHLFELAGAMCSRDAQKTLSAINDLYVKSFDMERLCSELISHFRALMICKTSTEAASFLAQSADDINRYIAQSDGVSLDSILFSLDILQNALVSMKRGADRRTEMELACVKICMNKSSDEISKRLDALERLLKTGGNFTSQDDTSRYSISRQPQQPLPAPPPQPQGHSAVQSSKTIAALRNDDVPFSDGPFDEWPQVLEFLKNNNKPLWSAMIGTTAYIQNAAIHVVCTNPTVLTALINRDKNKSYILTASYNVTGKKIRRLEAVEEGAALPAVEIQENNINSKLNDVILKAKSLGIDVTEEEE